MNSQCAVRMRQQLPWLCRRYIRCIPRVGQQGADLPKKQCRMRHQYRGASERHITFQVTALRAIVALLQHPLRQATSPAASPSSPHAARPLRQSVLSLGTQRLKFEGLQARGGFCVLSASVTPVQRRVRHIILPPDKQNLLTELQEELQGRLPALTLPLSHM